LITSPGLGVGPFDSLLDCLAVIGAAANAVSREEEEEEKEEKEEEEEEEEEEDDDDDDDADDEEEDEDDEEDDEEEEEEDDEDAVIQGVFEENLRVRDCSTGVETVFSFFPLKSKLYIPCESR
jgi:hypothetical protein